MFEHRVASFRLKEKVENTIDGYLPGAILPPGHLFPELAEVLDRWSAEGWEVVSTAAVYTANEYLIVTLRRALR